MATKKLDNILHELQKRRNEKRDTPLNHLLHVYESVKGYIPKNVTERDLKNHITFMLRSIASPQLAQLETNIRKDYENFKKTHSKFQNIDNKLGTLDLAWGSHKYKANKKRISKLNILNKRIVDNIDTYVKGSVFDRANKMENFSIILSHLHAVPQDHYDDKVHKAKYKAKITGSKLFKRVILPGIALAVLWQGYNFADKHKEEIITKTSSYFLPDTTQVDSIPYFEKDFEKAKILYERGNINQADSLTQNLMERIETYDSR